MYTLWVFIYREGNKLKSHSQSSRPHCRSLSRFQYYEVTRSIATYPWDIVKTGNPTVFIGILVPAWQVSPSILWGYPNDSSVTMVTTSRVFIESLNTMVTVRAIGPPGLSQWIVFSFPYFSRPFLLSFHSAIFSISCLHVGNNFNRPLKWLNKLSFPCFSLDRSSWSRNKCNRSLKWLNKLKKGTIR